MFDRRRNFLPSGLCGAAAAVLLGSATALAAPAAALDGGAKASAGAVIRLAQSVTEKEAFDSAKELGTIEAWEAFLNNFPEGFRADLARAYVRRLGAGENKAPEQAATPPAPSPQLAAQPPAPPPQPQFQPIHLGPGTSPWRNGTYSLDEGNSSAYAASVESSGLVFTTYCNASRTLTAVLGESQHGAYPQFDQRIAQGLAASVGQYGTNDQRMSIRFSDGSEEIVAANVMGLTGEVAIGIDQPGGGFQPHGSFMRSMMGANTMTLSSPPMSVTFQLTNSRGAVCSVLQRCGVSGPGCERFRPAPVSTRKPKPKVVKKKPKGCPGGTIFLEGRCMPRSQATSFCGPGYVVRGSKCVSQANVQQQPQQQQNAPTAVQILQGIAGALQQQQQKGKCPPGLIWEVDRCVEDD